MYTLEEFNELLKLRPFYNKNTRSAFRKQRAAARQRRIEWKLTELEWTKLWYDSHMWDKRGRLKEQYCMCRFDDEGPYSVDNVLIAPVAANMHCIVSKHVDPIDSF